MSSVHQLHCGKSIVNGSWPRGSSIYPRSAVCRRTRRETLLAVMFNITMIAWAVIDDSRPRRRALLDESCPFCCRGQSCLANSPACCLLMIDRCRWFTPIASNSGVNLRPRSCHTILARSIKIVPTISNLTKQPPSHPLTKKHDTKVWGSTRHSRHMVWCRSWSSSKDHPSCFG